MNNQELLKNFAADAAKAVSEALWESLDVCSHPNCDIYFDAIPVALHVYTDTNRYLTLEFVECYLDDDGELAYGDITNRYSDLLTYIALQMPSVYEIEEENARLQQDYENEMEHLRTASYCW